MSARLEKKKPFVGATFLASSTLLSYFASFINDPLKKWTIKVDDPSVPPLIHFLSLDDDGNDDDECFSTIQQQHDRFFFSNTKKKVNRRRVVLGSHQSFVCHFQFKSSLREQKKVKSKCLWGGNDIFLRGYIGSEAIRWRHRGFGSSKPLTDCVAYPVLLFFSTWDFWNWTHTYLTCRELLLCANGPSMQIPLLLHPWCVLAAAAVVAPFIQKANCQCIVRRYTLKKGGA